MLINKISSYFKQQVKSDEWPALLWSFLYFVFLLTGYFILRPIREEMGVTAGPENYGWLFLTTFIVMLLIQPFYGKVVSRYSRKQFIPIVYGFFGLMILLLWSLFHYVGKESVLLARVFFVFVSVYNLFIVSIFWSFMADVYNKEQGKRLFGVIAAGGSTGGILGGLITSQLVHHLGTINLLLVSFSFLMLCIYAVFRVRRFATDSTINQEAPLGGSAIEGIKLLIDSRFLQQIALMTVIAVIIGSIFYYLQGEYVRQFFPERDQRTYVFANINTITNFMTLFFQLILIPWLLQRVAIHKILGIFPCMMILALTLFGLMPMLYVVLGAIIFQRSGAYGIMKPPTDWLFTGLPDNIKYKFKNFLDTVVYRGGDVFAQLILVNYVFISESSLLHWLENKFNFDINDVLALTVFGVILSVVWLWNAVTVGKMAVKKFAEYERIS
ncbi:MFS transporter [Marinicella sp. S1101]|uniref:NTP/NDP exchange transporter n=1 Tax=Marinicella marina TaxID=2996016 RepID=UPI002261043C|nr:MFS transporter [Marinicella marina]MCX7553410.1 MFS transporter [Marinicella marina]MDJ1140034.1 MFS transporter [Marinicella marina]